MNEIVRAALACLGFYVAYVGGWVAYLLISRDGIYETEGSLFVIAVLWVILGACAYRWWALAIPVAPYLYFVSKAGGDPYHHGGGPTLEGLLAIACGSIGLGIALRWAWPRAVSVTSRVRRPDRT